MFAAVKNILTSAKFDNKLKTMFYFWQQMKPLVKI